jgi:hypothetical protein
MTCATIADWLYAYWAEISVSTLGLAVVLWVYSAYKLAVASRKGRF